MSEEEKSNEEEGKEEKEEEEEDKEKEKEGDDEEEKKDDKKKEKNKENKKNKKEKNEKTKVEKKGEENGKTDKKQLTLSKDNKPNLIPITNTVSDNNNNMTSRFPHYPLVPGEAQSSLQILSSINNDMDFLSKSLNSKFIGVSSQPLNNDNYKYNSLSSFSTNNYNCYYDKEDYEVKELLARAKQLINNTDNKIKLNNIFNSLNTKYENKLCQSGESNIKHFNNFNNYNNNNDLGNYNFNTTPDIYRNNNYNNNKTYNQYRSKSNINYNNNINNYENEEITDGYYRDEMLKRMNQNYNKNYQRKDFLNNVPNKNNYNANDNVIFKDYQKYKNNNKYEDPFFEDSLVNRTKKIEDLYKYTNNPRRKPMVYSQPDSTPINVRQRNISVDSNNYNNNNNYSISRDNIYNKKNSYLRFDNDGVNRAIDILNGKI